MTNYCITHCFPLTDSSQKDVIVPAVLQRDIEEASVVESIANSKVHPGADVFDLNLCCYVQRWWLSVTRGVRAVKHHHPLHWKHKHLIHTDDQQQKQKL